MRISRRIAVGLIALLLLAAVSPANASQEKTKEKSSTHGPVSFTLNAGPGACSQIQAALMGKGTFTNDLQVTTFPNGSRQVVDDKEANGKVVDPSGKSYKFHYVHHIIFTEAADGSVVHVNMTDDFVVKGDVRAYLMQAHFHWLWTYPLGDTTTIPTSVNMPWPPADNWVQMETGGDPLNCDPI